MSAKKKFEQKNFLELFKQNFSENKQKTELIETQSQLNSNLELDLELDFTYSLCEKKKTMNFKLFLETVN